MTPNIVFLALKKVCQELDRRNVSAVLVGGLALPIWNYPRSTQDIDLLLLINNDQQLISICDSVDCQPRRRPAIVDLGSIRVLQAELRPPGEYIEIDIDFLIGQSDFHTTVVNRAISIDYSELEFTIRVATCEDLILLKLQSSRLIDLADCRRLIELNSNLDWDHLNTWARKLQLEAALKQAESGEP